VQVAAGPFGLSLDLLLVAAMCAATALVVGAFVLATEPAVPVRRAVRVARPIATATRRTFLLGAGGGVAAFAVGWTLRGRLPTTAIAFASAPEPPAPAPAAPTAAPPAPTVPAPTAAPATSSAPVAPASAAAASAAPLAPTAVPASVSPAVAPASAAEYPAESDVPAVVASLPTAPAAPTVATAPTAPAAPTVAAVSTSVPAPTQAPKPTPRLQTQTMPGGRNNYVAGAPFVKNLGTGFVVSGTVLDAATGEPVRDTRIQIWLNTARGGEAMPSNRGSVKTDAEGRYHLETSPVVPQFGQPHVHIAYDDGAFDTLFLRPVLKSERDTAISVDFVLGRGGVA
jgi:hypothetical protein